MREAEERKLLAFLFIQLDAKSYIWVEAGRESWLTGCLSAPRFWEEGKCFTDWVQDMWRRILYTMEKPD